MLRYNKQLIFVAACMGMLIFGIVIAVLGSVLPSVIMKFRLDMVDAGSLFLFMNLGILLGSIVFGPVVDRYGYKGLLIFCALLVFMSMEGIALSPSINMLRTSLFVVGFAGGAINGGTNALVSDISEENRGAGLSFLGVFFGVGALGVPLLIGTLLDRFSYESLIGFVGFLILIPLLLFTVLKFPSPKHGRGFQLAEGLKLTREKTLLLFGFILFLQSGLEMTIGGWSATFMSEELAIQPRRSVLFLSFFWFGLIMVRLSMGEILKRVPGHKVMFASFATALAGSLMLLLSRDLSLTLPGLLLTGIGFAAVFPMVFAYVGDLYPDFSGTAFGVILVIAILGGMTYPYLIGMLAENFNIRTAMLMVVPLTLICSSVVFRITNGRISRGQ